MTDSDQGLRAIFHLASGESVPTDVPPDYLAAMQSRVVRHEPEPEGRTDEDRLREALMLHLGAQMEKGGLWLAENNAGTWIFPSTSIVSIKIPDSAGRGEVRLGFRAPSEG